MSNPFLPLSDATPTLEAVAQRAAGQIEADYPYGPAVPQITPERDRRVRLLAGSWLSLLVLCLAVNFGIVALFRFLAPRFSTAPTWPFLLVGVIPAQAGILSAWLVWSNEPFLRRLALHWATAAVLCWVWLSGYGPFEYGAAAFVETRANLVGALPLVALAVQFPLWITRLAFGWRLVRDDGEVAAADSPLTLRDLFLATLLVSVAVAFARSMPDAQADRYFWVAWAIAIPFVAVVSGLALLPAGRFLLATQRFSVGITSTVLYAACLIATMWLIVLTTWWIDPALLAPRAVFVGISNMTVGLAGTLMLAALAVRVHGYRLQIRRR